LTTKDIYKPNDEMKNIEYEKLVQEIYDALHEAEGSKAIVLHNTKIEGRSGCKHQIDVYWEFERAGQTFRVAVECKNYGDKVDIGRVRDFFGVLHDIGKINGILCTKVGFDSGSIKFAKYYDISLQEIRFPSQKDWTGRVKEIVVDLNCYKPDITACNIVPDGDWLRKTTVAKGKKIINFAPFQFCEDMNILDDSGKKITNLGEILDELQFDFAEANALIHKREFENGYIETMEHGRIKILSIELIYSVVCISGSQIVIDGEMIAKAIIKDVTTGKIKLFDVNGNIRE